MPTNDFLPFATGVGANVESQAAYLSDANRPLGNQPGIASAEFCNKAWRQSSFVTSQLAQMISNITGADVADNGVAAQFQGQLAGLLQRFDPKITSYLSSSGTHNITFYFFIAAGNASSGATYTNGSGTYTVGTTISGGVVLKTTGNAFPAALTGTLTKTGGAGDATLTFYYYRFPISMRVRGVGAGGSGSTTTVSGGDGGDSTFGTSFLLAAGGKAGVPTLNGTGGGGLGGIPTITGGLPGLTVTGGLGSGLGFTNANGVFFPVGGYGGSSMMGGGGKGQSPNTGTGSTAAAANSGGGGGASSNGNSSSVGSGSGGGGGGGIDILIPSASLLASYAWAVGAAGTGAGSNGGSGQWEVVEYFQ